MIDRTALRDRFLRDPLPVRLGGIASGLLRLQKTALQPALRSVAEGVLDEAKFLIEWTAPEAPIGIAAELADLQGLLARWHRGWGEISGDPIRLSDLSARAGDWSRRILDHSGLLG